MVGTIILWQDKVQFSAEAREDVSVSSREIVTDDTDDDEKSEDESKKSDLDDSEANNAEDEPETGVKDDWKEAPCTRLGHTVRTPSCLIEGASDVLGFTCQEAVGK